MTFFLEQKKLGFYFTTRTWELEFATTPEETLPNNSLLGRSRPRVPMTIRSMFSLFAPSVIADAGADSALMTSPVADKTPRLFASRV